MFPEGSGFHSESPPPLTPAVPGTPPPPAVGASFLPQKSIWVCGGEGGEPWLGRGVILSSQRMSFIPDVISRGMIPPCQLPLNLGVCSRNGTQSTGTESMSLSAHVHAHLCTSVAHALAFTHSFISTDVSWASAMLQALCQTLERAPGTRHLWSCPHGA